MHANGSVVPADVQPSTLKLDAILSRCAEVVPAERLYDQYVLREIHFGRSFRGVERVRRGDAEVLAEIIAPDNTVMQQDYVVHPALWMRVSRHYSPSFPTLVPTKRQRSLFRAAMILSRSIVTFDRAVCGAMHRCGPPGMWGR